MNGPDHRARAAPQAGIAQMKQTTQPSRTRSSTMSATPVVRRLLMQATPPLPTPALHKVRTPANHDSSTHTQEPFRQNPMRSSSASGGQTIAAHRESLEGGFRKAGVQDKEVHTKSKGGRSAKSSAGEGTFSGKLSMISGAGLDLGQSDPDVRLRSLT